MNRVILEEALGKFSVAKQSKKEITCSFTLHELELIVRGLYELGDDHEGIQILFEGIFDAMEILATNIALTEGEFDKEEKRFGMSPVANCYWAITRLRSKD
jgi:hypothetical protein